MMSPVKKQGSAKNISEIEFREWFYQEFGINYIDVINKLNDQKRETERKWNQTLTRYGLNN